MFGSVETMLEVPDLFQQVLIAIAIGGLIGIEREKESANKFAGLRTLALLCGSAPLMVYYSELVGYPLLVGIYLVMAFVLSLTIIYIRFTLRGSDVGFTTSIAFFLVALLGILVGYGRFFEATSIAIIVAFLLSEKETMIKHVNNLTYEELSDSIKLGALVFILYPILPTEPIDPYGVVRLREVLTFAIFVLLIEFSSYVSMRQFGGSTGLQLTGILAGGANSLATAGVMARMVNQSRDALNSASSALLLATVSMILRNVGIVSIIAFGIFWVVWKAAIVMVVLTVLLAYLWLALGKTYEDFDIDLDSPFSFKSAAKFSVVYIVITVVSVLAQEFFGNLGLYATAFFGGLASSAAVSVTAGTVFNDGSVGVEAAGGMVLLGILASLIAKIALVEVINSEMRYKASVPMGIVGVTGVVVYFTL